MKHKNLRRLLTLLLTLSLAAAMAAPAAAFTNYDSWALATLNEADLLGLLPDSLKNADMRENINRTEMCYIATLAYEKLTGNEPFPNRTDYFTDTEDPLICAAYEIGLVKGYDDGTFCPDKNLTRQEFFVILSNLNRICDMPRNLSEDYLKNFADRHIVGTWAEEAAQEMAGLGIVQGEVLGNMRYLQPEHETTRQQAIAMFLRCYKNAEMFRGTDWVTQEELDAIRAEAAAQIANSEAAKLVDYALTFVGKPYVFGANGPNSFDCSGFTRYVFAHFGYNINRVANDQAKNGTAVSFEQLKPGDLVLFSNTYSSREWITHVGIYIGNGRIVHAANTTRGVTVDTITSGYYRSHYATARRILP